MTKNSFHSLCRWTFHAGKGGFVPANIRPDWSDDQLGTTGVIEVIRKKIKPRLPDHVILGYELHYDNEVNERTASEISAALVDSGMYLAMITPGAHIHFGYGGIASLDDRERQAAEQFGTRTVDIAYRQMRECWHPDNSHFPTLVVWNGSFGYDLATIGVQEMYRRMKESLSTLCRYEQKMGGELYMAIEPKPNEGHAAMLLPTVASVILLWRKLNLEHGISLDKKGVNKEFGHSEMIGLDHVYDTVEEIDNGMLVHMHINSQGYNDGIILGGPGKFDIDNGARINGMNIAIAGLVKNTGYQRWKGHDMQPRPYDDVNQAIDRVIRSILSWEACQKAADDLDEKKLLKYLGERQTARAEDMMREAVTAAQRHFDRWYR